jgi:RNA polymerase sigma-70 factor (ECF subfamily)
MLTVFTLTTESVVLNKNALIEGLIKRLADGDNRAIGELYDLIRTDVFAYAFSKMGNSVDAEDVMQETFIKVYKFARQYEPKGKPLAWIFTIEINLIRRYYQIANRTVAIEDEVFNDDGFEQKILNDAFLQQMLSNLTEEEREIIVLHAVSGLKHREISQLIEKPLATVISKYNRAVKKLQEIAKEVKQ